MALNSGYAYREQIGGRAQGQNLLSYLAGRYPHSTPAEWQERLERGEVQLDGQIASGEETLQIGQILIWQRPPWQEDAAPLHFEVLYQDAAVLAVTKPSGLPTLPGGGFLEHTLLHLVRAEFPQASPLHRLGRGTSGLVLFARTTAAAASLSRAWREQQIGKRYLALSAGHAGQDAYDIRTPIGPVPHPLLDEVYAASPAGKASRSLARVLERRGTAELQTLFEVDILTGRPHQIRIHLASIGLPLLGDPLYGVGGLPLPHLPGLPGDGGYWLHAHRLRFVHPVSGEVLEITAPPPPILQIGGQLPPQLPGSAGPNTSGG
ncbi:RluA family pseudouridine synthase [Deinococcus detaillensis]|uniref:Pseudouridine synthase n=1 Tax=Deinococcus detaillensis TaxID=2592048 RepID=A0A553V446_9DEIO|nr:RluA family pseudouridine synthase [Deinococcus detaillensis]TSA87268.1 RluA family pseudouridine synthase [Deinococcus detaillensis]